MTWDELRQYWSFLPKTSDGWHQHANGGGWVPDTAFVSESASICEAARIGESVSICEAASIGEAARIGARASIGVRASIGAWARIGESASIGASASIGEWASIGASVSIGAWARIGESASIGAWARIGESASIGESVSICEAASIGEAVSIREAPIYIQGTRYFICYVGGDLIQSGCITKPLKWWLENIERCAEEHGYTRQQQQEYRIYVTLIRDWMILHGYHKPESTNNQDAGGRTP